MTSRIAGPMPLGIAVITVMAVATGLTAMPAPATAQFFFGPPRERIVELQRPVRGYSGFVRQGARSYYCDYVRYPNRSCTIDRAGRERCRVTGWRMVQRCN